MDIINVLAAAISKIVTTTIFVLVWSMTAIDQGLRAPLRHLGVEGVTQTLFVVAVPLLSMIAAYKMMRGFFRVLVILILFSFFVFLVGPLVLGLLNR